MANRFATIFQNPLRQVHLPNLIKGLISDVKAESWEPELEKISHRYVTLACWVAVVFDPIFAIVDYLNIPAHWVALLIARLAVAVIIMAAWFLRKRLRLTSAMLVSVPFMTISLQNAYVYLFIGPEHALGQNLNFIALIIGASLFVLWRWMYSVVMVGIAAFVTWLCIYYNPNLSMNAFFLNGGLLLILSAVFMIVMINARFILTVREIKTRVALAESVSTLQHQAEEIKSINENLEKMVSARTNELESKNQVLEEYAFLTAHKLRGPVASVLGLLAVFRSLKLDQPTSEVVDHLEKSTQKLDSIVMTMIRTIERGELHHDDQEDKGDPAS